MYGCCAIKRFESDGIIAPTYRITAMKLNRLNKNKRQQYNKNKLRIMHVCNKYYNVGISLFLFLMGIGGESSAL